VGVWTKKEFPPAPPAPGLTSFAVDKSADTTSLHAGGFSATGGRAIRFDMLERLEDELEKALSSGTDAETLLTKLVSLLGSGKDEARNVLTTLAPDGLCTGNFHRAPTKCRQNVAGFVLPDPAAMTSLSRAFPHRARRQGFFQFVFQRSSMSKRMARPPVAEKSAGMQRGRVSTFIDGERCQARRGAGRWGNSFLVQTPTAASVVPPHRGRSSLGR